MLRPNVALELHHVARWIGHHEGLMLVSAARESNRGAHQEFDAQFLEMIFQPGKICHMQQGQAVMPGVGARIGRDCTPLQVTYQLQDAAEAERDAVLEDTHGLRPEDFRVPAGRLLEVAARHGDVRDITSRRDRGVVQQAGGGLEFCGVGANCGCFTASARSLPARTSDMAAGMVTMSNGTCPPSVSATAGPPPLYGTWTMSIPVRSISSSPAMCDGVPLPTEAKCRRPGSALAIATMSAMLSICAPG